MYGRGNYAPQFGQGLQRPMPPYQQPPAGHPPPRPFQPGQPFPMQPLNQQGGPPLGAPPRGPGYPHVPPAPFNMPPQGPPNPSQSFLQRPLLHGVPPPRPPYLGSQHNFPSGTQIPHQSAPPPPPQSIGLSRPLPPHPLQRPAGYTVLPPPPPQTPNGFFTSPNFEPATQKLNAGSHMPLLQQPPPPPPSFLPVVPDPRPSSLVGGSPITYGDVPGQKHITELGSTADVKIGSGEEGTLISRSVQVELPPPPKPADEKVLRNIEVLCQFISKNGSQFEEMARNNESGNPDFSFLVGGKPGSEASRAQEYYLWMKKKYGLLNDLGGGQEQKNLSERHAGGEASAVLNSSANVTAVHSPDDSDVDMEDDITQTDKEPEVDKPGEDLKSEVAATGAVLEIQKQEIMLLDTSDGDITQSVEEPEVYKSGKHIQSEPVSTGEVLEMHKQESVLPYTRDGELAASFNDITQTNQEPEDYEPVEDLKSELVSIGEVFEMRKQEALEDTTETDKEPEVHKLGEDVKPECVSNVEMLKTHKQETMLLNSRGSSSSLNSDPPINSKNKAEMKPEGSSGQHGSIDSPFSLIRNYASDDNSEDELLHEQGSAQAVSPSSKSGFPIVYDNIKSGTKSEPRLAESVTVSVDSLFINKGALSLQSESRGTSSKGASPEKHSINDMNNEDEPSNLNASFHGNSAMESAGIGYAAPKDFDRNDKKSTSSAQKVDEFGRLVKVSASDSESDGTRHVRRRGRRDRSRSRSRSPSDRKRRRSPRRSPRRKIRRSRSPSWSPKRRRSRSRSPYRSGGDFGGDKLRRGNTQTQQCFDYLKGRCYRGASCRYVHHDVSKSESSRRYEGKQYQENMASARNSDFGYRVTSTVPSEHTDMKSEKITLHQDKRDGDNLTSKAKDGIHENVKVQPTIDGVPDLLHEDMENAGADFKASEGHLEDPAHVLGASEEHMPHLPIAGEFPTFEMTSTTQSVRHASDDGEKSTMVDSGKTECSAVETSLNSSGIPMEPYHTSNDPSAASASISGFRNQLSHSPQPSLALPAVNTPQQSKSLVELNSMTSSVSLPPQTVPLHAIPPYHAPLSSQQSQYPDPANSAWSILPPPQPRPPHLIDSSVTSAPLQFQQGSNPLRTDFQNQLSSRAHSGELAGQSQAGGFQYQTYRLPSGIVSSTPFPGPSLVRDDRLSQFPSHGHGSAGPFTPGVPPQSGLFPGNSNIMQSYPGTNMFAGDSSKQGHHNNQLPSRFMDAGGSGISAHYNPYASTFDQPLSSRFSSAFAQERVSASGMKYDSSISLSRGPVEGRMPRSGGDQYDPLFDSMESSSKRAQKQDNAADNSDTLNISSHQQVLDVAENKNKKDGVAPTSLENDEYGETADAEVGAVENGSLSDTDDDANVLEGEIEIDQIKAGEDNETGKESRSMKLFKVAVANFVKEVLKPQWRQGNMSKEVFKTIVKKTVDKVSSSMKNHRVPKSQAKIDHYINSSRRKLTQLVEGYVSKYKS